MLSLCSTAAGTTTSCPWLPEISPMIVQSRDLARQVQNAAQATSATTRPPATRSPPRCTLDFIVSRRQSQSRASQISVSGGALPANIAAGPDPFCSVCAAPSSRGALGAWLAVCLIPIAMSAPSPIVLASDFGEAARLAVNDAVLLANAFETEVLLVHVQPSTPHTALSARALEEHTRQLVEASVARIAEAGGRVAGHQVLSGSPAETILHVADRVGADWLVLGAGDRSARSLLTGTTAETVARFATQRVWISRPRPTRPLLRIGCGVDYSASSGDALRLAADLAARTGASLHVAHAAAAADTRAHLLQYLLDSGAKVEAANVTAAAGAPDEVLRAFVADRGIDLLILGRTGTSGLRRVFLGGTAERLLRSVPCSLLLASPAAGREPLR